MKAQRDFTILLMHQIEKLSTVEIYQYFESSISIEYITDILSNADNNDEYFDKILDDYLAC